VVSVALLLLFSFVGAYLPSGASVSRLGGPSRALSTSASASCPTENPHAAIRITSNAGFTAANGVVSGSGTLQNPYIVGDLKIDNLSPGYGLEVDNSAGHITVHFELECLTTGYSVLPPGGATFIVLKGIQGPATVSSISGNGGETAGTSGVLVESSSSVLVTNLQLNKLGGTALEIAASNHISVTDSKVKSTAHGGDGLFITGSHDIRVGSACNPQGGQGCDEFTYDDARGLHIRDSYNIRVLNTVVSSDDSGGILIEGSSSYNITLSSSSVSAWGPVCPHGTPTGVVSDTISGLAIADGAHGITVENYSITSFGTSPGFFGIMNGGNGLYLNPCTLVEQKVTPTTPPGGGGYTFVKVCWMTEYGFNPVPARTCS
jgi:hypothetical protein